MQEFYAVKTPTGKYVGFGQTEDAAKRDAKHWCINLKICTVVKVKVTE